MVEWQGVKIAYLSQKNSILTIKNIRIMKKLFFLFLLGACFLLSANAQTASEAQERANKELIKLNKELNQVKSRIYYLEVELPILLEESKNSKRRNTKLEKDLYFSAQELPKLKSRQLALEESIGRLEKNQLSNSEDYQVSYSADVPQKMGPCDFKQRTRSQHFRVNEALAQQVIDQAKSGDTYSEAGIGSSDALGYGLPGLLINNKRGTDENVTFRFSRRNFRGFADQIYSLRPQERLWVKLPAGEYLVEISMGSQLMGTGLCKVDPANIKYADGQKCYFWAEKTYSDF